MKKIKTIVIMILSIGSASVLIYADLLLEMLRQKDTQFKRIKRNYLFLNEWMEKKRRHPSKLVDSLSKNGFQKIGIYGAGDIGFQLYRELLNYKIDVVCFIDKNKKECVPKVLCYPLDMQLPDIDAIIVTVLHSYQEIESDIRKRYAGEILFLEELI